MWGRHCCGPPLLVEMVLLVVAAPLVELARLVVVRPPLLGEVGLLAVPVTRVLVEVPLLAALLVLDLALLVALGVPGLLKTEHRKASDAANELSEETVSSRQACLAPTKRTTATAAEDTKALSTEKPETALPGCNTSKQRPL